MTDTPDFTALIASRICHDLVNPIGAIGNGVELMVMDGAERGPELALIAQSVASASARIRFFRIAFGSATDLRLARPDVQSILADLFAGTRITAEWNSAADLPRSEVRLAFLAIQCLESAMPYGGTVTVTQSGTGWQVAAKAGRFRADPVLWHSLTSGEPLPGVTPAQVQFALLPDGCARLGRTLHHMADDTGLRLSF